MKKKELMGALTKRELQVTKKVAMGKSTPQIAKELKISTHTVTTHRKNVRRKLDDNFPMILNDLERRFRPQMA